MPISKITLECLRCCHYLGIKNSIGRSTIGRGSICHCGISCREVNLLTFYSDISSSNPNGILLISLLFLVIRGNNCELVNLIQTLPTFNIMGYDFIEQFVIQILFTGTSVDFLTHTQPHTLPSTFSQNLFPHLSFKHGDCDFFLGDFFFELFYTLKFVLHDICSHMFKR